MIKKKVCMLGSFAVGKTSLVRQFVQGIFSDKYLTTVGVKIDKKTIELAGEEVQMMLWDIAGEDGFQRIQTTYLRGMAGYILVVDGTRRSTLEEAKNIFLRIDEMDIGSVPHVVFLNKIDLTDEWELKGEDIASLNEIEARAFKTSAKTNEGLEEGFLNLAEMMVKQG
ncbi:MAG: GTP-binding protein [Candidatus Coatesbacteria bacterium]|nr:GTP-binding protein [Candidatus Coatesbacteria bacterium]